MSGKRKIQEINTTDLLGEFVNGFTWEIIRDGKRVGKGWGPTNKIAKKKARENYKRDYPEG